MTSTITAQMPDKKFSFKAPTLSKTVGISKRKTGFKLRMAVVAIGLYLLFHWLRTMKSFRLAINYTNRWDNLDYMDGQLIGELVENKLSYNELVEKTYILTGIDRNIYDIILYGVIKLRSCWTKYHVKRDNDIDFVFRDDSPIKEIYVDMKKRVDRGGDGDGDGHDN
ncbi:hypothetical protein Q3G72_016634 [Acer saccharum]|nr:hypothetical protein Q3G72_016634 [Acer saccharum]